MLGEDENADRRAAHERLFYNSISKAPNSRAGSIIRNESKLNILGQRGL